MDCATIGDRRVMRKPRRIVRPRLDRLDDRCLPSGLTVAQLTHAYGLDAIAFPSASGAPVVRATARARRSP